MAIDLIFQGFTSKTHKAALEHVLAVPRLERAILSAAFVNEGGVALMEEAVRGRGSKIDFYAGIRNDITSRQALERLLAMKVRLVTVDTGSTHVTYHPKIYLGRGRDTARLLLGSANFTPGGLNNNIEASLALDFNLAVAAERKVVEDLEALFDGLEEEYPDHVTEIEKAKDLLDLQAAGRLVDQAEVVKPIVTRLGGDRASDTIKKIRLKTVSVKPLLKPLRILTGGSVILPRFSGHPC